MQLHSAQSAFSELATAGPSLVAALPRPTTVGNMLLVHLRFSPLTGTPNLADNFGNRFERLGIANLGTVAVGFWFADLVRAGANHAITAASSGGNQIVQLSVTEMSLVGLEHGEDTERAIQLAMLAEQAQQTDFLRRLCTAERA